MPSKNCAEEERVSRAPELALGSPELTRPSTPIAAKLQEHFARGGSVVDGVRLVESLECAALTVKSRAKESSGRGTRLSADWQPSRVDLPSHSIAG
jgi:hypothetical protein